MNAPAPRGARPAAGSLAQRMHLPRTVGLALGGVCVGVAMLQRGTTPPWLWGLLAFHALAWPHIAYAWARRGKAVSPREWRNLLVDSALGGWWVAAMGFNVLPSVLVIVMLTVNNLAIGESRLFLAGLLAQAAGAAAGWWLIGGRPEVTAGLPVILACLPFLVAYPLILSLTTHRLARSLGQQKKALERSERQYRMTLDAMDAGIALYDADDRLVLSNRHFRDLYRSMGKMLVPGRRFEELLREALAKQLIPQAAGRESAWIQERLEAHARPRGAILRELPGDRWRRIVEQRLRDGSLLAFSTDVTEHVRREKVIQRSAEELRRARDEAVAASSAKSAFLANMSHEIRTPLTSIIGFAELLQGPQLTPDDKASSVLSIIRNGRHLLEVINDILDLSKIETGQVEVERLAIDLPILLRDLGTLVSGRATEKSLAFALTPQLPLPATFVSDPVRVKQILLNFCSNAIKFTSRGTVRLDVRYQAAPPVLVFSVCDTGIGMTPEQLSRLFQPFAQADVSTTRRFGGTGLGLYLSRQLAQALGARIEVESTPGQGSRFHLHLPLDPAPASTDLLTLEGDLQVRERVDFVASGFMVPDLSGRLLLAEDGVDNQRLLAAYLKQAGLEVTVVGNGREAVETALAREFDLVLMDIQMPVLDGVEATRLLRAAGYARPIVALTANVMKADVQRYREIGCDDVLAKPVERERFYEVIAAQLAQHRRARSATPDDDEFDREMAALHAEFRAGLPSHIDTVRQALARADWPGLQSLIHTLKGTAGSYGFPRLTELSAQIEAEIAAGRPGRATVLCEGLILEARGALLVAAR